MKIPPSESHGSNPAVQAAVEHARAQYLRVRENAGPYGPAWTLPRSMLTSPPTTTTANITNSFQPNNATVGVSIHFLS